jgi:uncharacterized protein
MKTTDKKLVLLASILAAGIFAATFASTQLINANAQVNNSTNNSSKTVTSVDCSKVVPSVHCVDGNGTASASDTPMPVDIGCPTGTEVCEDRSNSTMHSTVTTSGTATTKVQPDKFTVTVGVETNGTTAEKAASSNANLSAKVIDALKALGISENDTSTSNYNVYPVYESKLPSDKVCIDIYPPPPGCGQSQVITGYKASNSVSVTLDTSGDIDAGKVIDTAIKGGANTVSGASYFLSQDKQQQVQDDLIRDAIANARHRADIAADAVGMQVSSIQSISLNDVNFPIFARETAAQSSDTQILPGQQEVTMTVSVVYVMNGASAGTNNGGEDTRATDNAVAIARQFVLSKLPSLGIQINNEFDLHSDMVVELTESEFHVEFSVMDTNGQSHDGHIEITNGEVTVAVMDGKSIL